MPKTNVWTAGCPLSRPTCGTVTQLTLIRLRWVAVAGQAGALLLAQPLLMLPPLVFGLAFALIGLSFLLNLLVTTQGRWSHHVLTPRAATAYLAFDVVQLSLLLALTGGLGNPFVVMLLAPMAFAASLLPRQGVLTILLLLLLGLTLMGNFYVDLPWMMREWRPAYAYSIWLAMLMAAIFIAVYSFRTAEESRTIAAAVNALRDALGRERERSSLVALAAAAAHELGSPLATIAIIAREMEKDVASGTPLAEDVQLLKSQTERCRQILRQLGARNLPTEGMAEKLPLSAVIEKCLALLPAERPVRVLKDPPRERDDTPEPVLAPLPEREQGLLSLLQNAQSFAAREVTVTLSWSRDHYSVIIDDDGPGFPPALLPRLGEPYVTTRAGNAEHLGLGLFIAETLLEQTGATLTFANRPTTSEASGGARVTVHWAATEDVLQKPAERDSEAHEHRDSSCG